MKNIFLTQSNLPDNDVTEAIVSSCDNSLILKLKEIGINSLEILKNANLEPSVESHADLQAYHLGNSEFIADKSFKSDYNVLKYIHVASPYPYDCCLNAADIGDYVICNEKITDSLIIEKAILNGKSIINVKQGYAKCSVCIIKKNTIITDDESIYRAVKSHNIESLLISKGSVELPGQNYGFFGGTTGLIGKNKLFINGDLSFHKDYLAIKEYLDYYNVSYIDIKNKPLTDVGSILPIKQKGS